MNQVTTLNPCTQAKEFFYVTSIRHHTLSAAATAASMLDSWLTRRRKKREARKKEGKKEKEGKKDKEGGKKRKANHPMFPRVCRSSSRV